MKPRREVASEKLVFTILIAVGALGSLLLFSVFMKIYMDKNGTGQLPETIVSAYHIAAFV